MRCLPLACVLLIFVLHETEAAHPKFLRAHDEVSTKATAVSKREGGTRLANLVAKKIRQLTKEIFKNAKTEFDRRNLLDQLQLIITDTAKRNNFTNEDIRTSTKLIIEGIEFALKSMENSNDNVRRSNISPKENTKSPPTVPRKDKPSRCRGCACLARDVCAKVSRLKTLVCHSDGSIVGLQHLCDGDVNCLDASDEKQCEKKLTTKVSRTEHILDTLQTSIEVDHCFQMHNDSLLEVLSSQRAGLNIVKEAFVSEKIANHGTVVINMIALTLKESFCSPQIIVNPMKNDNTEVVSSLTTHSENTITARALVKSSTPGRRVLLPEVVKPWTPESCWCHQGACRLAGCDPRCRAPCRHRHLLARWECPTFNNTNSIPLSALCDTIPDCRDESDENNCTNVNGSPFGKFEAEKILNDIEDQIKSKLKYNEYIPARPLLQTLIIQVEKLQPKMKNMKVIETRNEVINALVTIYASMEEKMTSEKKEEAVYVFLKNMSIAVVEAVKRQGEVKLQELACRCAGAGCALASCSRTCARECAVSQRLRLVSCAGARVPPAAICNRTRECSDGSDERNCHTGYCQKYHLTMLKRNVARVLKRYEGTSLGDLMSSWETKVQERLEHHLKSGKANRGLLLALVTDSLEELVGTYAALEERRRGGEGALLKAMEAAAAQLMYALKMCTI